MKVTRPIILTALASMAAGCAHLPNGEVGYYLPTSDVTFRVVRVMACDKQNNLIEADQITPTVKSYADPTTYRVVRFKKLGGALSDSDVKFEWYDGKRLSAVNASSTGEGEAVLKSAFTVATTLLGVGVGVAALDPVGTCAKIKAFGGDKPLTLTYEGKINLSAGKTEMQPIAATADSAYYVDQIGSAVGGVSALVLGHAVPKAPFNDPDIDQAAAAAGTSRTPVLAAKEPGTVTVEIDVGRDQKLAWKDDLTVATFGTVYYLPMPGPLVFGKKTMAVAFTETGSLKSLQYISNTGASGALNVVNAGLGAGSQGDVARAAALKAEADILAQQQRLVACKADPTTCK